jgi:hypothetical protein
VTRGKRDSLCTREGVCLECNVIALQEALQERSVLPSRVLDLSQSCDLDLPSVGGKEGVNVPACSFWVDAHLQNRDAPFGPSFSGSVNAPAQNATTVAP